MTVNGNFSEQHRDIHCLFDISDHQRKLHPQLRDIQRSLGKHVCERQLDALGRATFNNNNGTVTLNGCVLSLHQCPHNRDLQQLYSEQMTLPYIMPI